MDDALCYQAVLSRDRRFDGRFFTGAVTTGIYCRPICPVPAAKFENVRWFASATAAEAAGFRPCQRCRPETAPDTPAWIGSSAVVARALRLIGDGALDENKSEALAARLGIGERQLQRLFKEHLGASPGVVSRARRVHFAAKLIGETRLPITEVALCAGFSSIRQFNHAFHAAFGQSPSGLRKRRTDDGPRLSADTVTTGGELVVRLSYRQPLDWAALLRFLQLHATPGIEVVENDSYRRTIEVDGAAGTIELRPIADGAHLRMRVQLPSNDRLIDVVRRVRRVFDLDADPLQITSRLRYSPHLGRLVERSPGVRVPGAWDSFEVAVRAVLGQQLTMAGATTLAKRLVKAFGQPVQGAAASRGLTHFFPRPEVLAEAKLGCIGISSARAATIRHLAVRMASGDLLFNAGQDVEDVVARLCDIPGISHWTAQYIALRALGDPDTFPAGDIGLRRALADGGAPLTPTHLARLAEAWRPWRAYAALYLWSSLRRPQTTASAGRLRIP